MLDPVLRRGARIFVSEFALNSNNPVAIVFERETTGYPKSGYIYSVDGTISILANQSQPFTLTSTQTWTLRAEDRLIIYRILIRTTSGANVNVRINLNCWTEEELWALEAEGVSLASFFQNVARRRIPQKKR